ncbi:hypothetical protein VCHA51O448_20020 [Vibrio chagasii]|nr:hypothetical protein VCHA53O468_10123 [Vibrio chagasii]CAH7109300.1 hypothetical protein VCHA48P435_20125 [Vibrio chagasii]CAH7115508.1 hypothetical protein VCHA55O507_10531 [Vibrio chagasii]CAH7161852.1 hypothetical protein VCHA51O448_20020 [Vibrio chagasii]CAH7465253.1 hypothetical protein VCHA54P501_40294 [Vibrio chagasii]
MATISIYPNANRTSIYLQTCSPTEASAIDLINQFLSESSLVAYSDEHFCEITLPREIKSIEYKENSFSFIREATLQITMPNAVLHRMNKPKFLALGSYLTEGDTLSKFWTEYECSNDFESKCFGEHLGNLMEV